MAVVTTWRGRRAPARAVEGLEYAADCAEEMGDLVAARAYREIAHDLADSLDEVPLPAVNPPPGREIMLPAKPWSPANLRSA